MRSAASRSTRSWSVLKILLLRRAPNKSCFATFSSPAGASYSLPNWRVSAVCCGSSFGCCGSSSVGTGVGSGETLVCPRGGSVRGAGIGGAALDVVGPIFSPRWKSGDAFHSSLVLLSRLSSAPARVELVSSRTPWAPSSLNKTNHPTYQTMSTTTLARSMANKFTRGGAWPD